MSNQLMEYKFLGEVIEIYDHKRIPLSSKVRKKRNGRFPYYGASGVIDNIDDYIFEGNYLLIAEDGENLNSRKLPIAFKASGKFWVNNHAHIVKALKGKSTDSYIEALLNYIDIRPYVTGAAQPKLNQKNLKKIKLFFPDYKTQLRTSKFLDNINDLIYNNTARIKILEEIAQNLYEEWFVNFKFPGYEKVKMVDSELGKVPDDWRISKLGKEIELKYGKGLTKKNRKKGSVLVYGSSGLVGFHDEHLMEGPGIVVGRKGNVGSVFWINNKFFPIDTTYFVVTNHSLFYVYYNLKKQNFINNDAAVPGLNRNQAYSLPFIVPSQNIVNAFDKFINPVFQQVAMLKSKNRVLENIRDILLPRLISGETEV